MPSDNSINLLYFDIYSKRITFFYDKKEKIGSYFGLSLTLTYIFASLILFIYYFAITIERKEINVFDSTEYSEQTPSLDVNEKLIYLAFGIEDKQTSSRFIDETIYYPQILFIKRAKQDGMFKTVSSQELPYERCNETKFGPHYQKFFYKGELNNSYCIKTFNLTLAGGYKYDIMNYIRIKIYPCINGTKNHFNCKPKEIVDSYISGSYFSLIIKDIGLNPTNYSSPLSPTIQNLYTSLDKQFFRDFILYFGLSEIHSDIGYFNEILIKEKYLRFRRHEQTFYFRDINKYEEGNEICVLQIRLDDNIEIQKRSYTKLPQIFSLIGGYMQLISTSFSIISLVVNKIGPEIKILNDIFNFNVKKGKMMMKIHSLKDLSLITLARKSKGNIFPIRNINRFKRLSNDKSFKSKKSEIELDISNSLTPITIVNKKEDLLSLDLKSQKKNENIKNSSFIKSPKHNKNSMSNVLNKVSVEDKESETKIFQGRINFNLFEYYCLRRLTSKSRQIDLFRKGRAIYRKKMDIINVFTLLLLTEKKLLNKEHKNNKKKN